MKLKRYVMLKNGMIINEHRPDTFRNKGFEYVESRTDNILWWRCFDEEDVIKTSDDILELIEVGDLVEIDGMNGIYYINEIDVSREDGLKSFVCDQIHGYWYDFNETEIITIYKRQPNGDYKRYEVKS